MPPCPLLTSSRHSARHAHAEGSQPFHWGHPLTTRGGTRVPPPIRATTPAGSASASLRMHIVNLPSVPTLHTARCFRFKVFSSLARLKIGREDHTTNILILCSVLPTSASNFELTRATRARTPRKLPRHQSMSTSADVPTASSRLPLMQTRENGVSAVPAEATLHQCHVPLTWVSPCTSFAARRSAISGSRLGSTSRLARDIHCRTTLAAQAAVNRAQFSSRAPQATP